MRCFVVIAAVCALSLLANVLLAWRLSVVDAEVVNLQLTTTKLQAALEADEVGHAIRDQLYQEAHINAQQKYDAINSVSDDLPAGDYLDGLRGWMRPQGANNRTDTAGKPDAANATPGTAGGAHADR